MASPLLICTKHTPFGRTLMLVIVGVKPFGWSGVGAEGARHDVKGDRDTGGWAADSVFTFQTCIVPDDVMAIRKYLDA